MIEEKKPWYKCIPFGVILWCLTIVFGAGIIYAVAKDAPKKHDELKAHTQKVEAKADANKEVLVKNRQDIAVLKNDIKYIRQGIGDIKRAVMRPRNP